MQNEDSRNIFFEFEEQKDKENDNDRILEAGNELQRKIDVECYDKVMEYYPNYLSIVYIHIIKFKQILTAFTSTKVKSLRKINNGISFIIL
jgi:hypothetical protein